MSEQKELNSIEFNIRELEYVEAGDDFRDYTRPYRESINAFIDIFLNGEKLQISAKYDLFDTSRGFYEMLKNLDEDESYQDTPFCDVNGYRESLVVKWYIEKVNNSKFKIAIKDNMNRSIGKSKYIVSIEVLEKATLDLLDTIIDFMESENIQSLEWAEWQEHSDDSRNTWGTLEELKNYRDELK